MIFFQIILINRTIIFIENFTDRIIILFAHFLHNGSSLWLQDPFQGGQYFRNLSCIHSLNILPHQIKIDPSRNRLPLNHFHRKGIIKCFLKLLHLCSKLLPQVFILQLFDMSKFILLSNRSWKALTPSMGKKLSNLLPDLVLWVVFVDW